MENRFVYFAASAEQQKNAEISRTEKSPDRIQKTAEDLANIEKAGKGQVERGGRRAKGEASALVNSGKITDVAKSKLKERIASADKAAAELSQNPGNSNKIDALNKAVSVLKKSVEFQKKQMAKNATENSKFERFKSLANANELFKDVKVSMKSETKGGQFEITWKEFNSLEGFKKLGFAQKEAFNKALNEKLTGKNPEGANAIDGILKKFKNNKMLPKKWTREGGYIDNPEKWGDTREHAAKWLQENADKKILHTETALKFLEGQQHLLEKAGIKMPSRDEIFEKSTSEYNQYFEGLKQKIAKMDTEAAVQIDKMKVSEGAKIETAQVEMKTSGEEKEKAASEGFDGLAKKIQNSPIRKDFMRELDTKKKEAKKDKSSDVQNRMTAARGGEAQPSFFKKIALKLRGGKPEQPQEDDTETHEQASKAVVDDLIGTESEAMDRDENLKLSDSQRKQIAEMFGFKELPKGREWENPLAILMLKDVDAKSVEDATKRNREWWKGRTGLFS